MNGGTLATPTPTPTPSNRINESTKLKLTLAAISGIVSIIVAIITVFGTIFASENRISDLWSRYGQISAPAGTIVPYGGSLDLDGLKKTGWLLCNGDSISRAEYKDLFNVIGVSWGEGDHARTFNLPDLRGVFLRGVNGTRNDTFSDPEAENRVNGAGQKNAVGSYQQDEVGPHTHPVNLEGSAKRASSGADEQSNTLTTHQDGFNPVGQNTAKETRPKNAYVYYLIKY